MKALAPGFVLACLLGCTTPLQQGERSYREGDRLGALEIWRQIPEDSGDSEEALERIRVVEAEFQRLVVQYKQRGRYFEDKERLAESILNYRLALELQPSDAATMDHVQHLARALDRRKRELYAQYTAAFEAGSLASARAHLSELRTLDPFDPQIETEERQLQVALRAEMDRLMETGRRAFAAGEHRAAGRFFEEVLEFDPDNESARGYLSYIASLRETPRDDGPRAFERSGGFASEAEIRAEGFYQNARAAERQGRLYTAIRHDLSALEANPRHRRANNHLQALRQRLAPEVDRLIEAGRGAFREEDLQTALDHWRRAQLVAPDNERVTAYIGRAEQQLQNLERLRSEPDSGPVP